MAIPYVYNGSSWVPAPMKQYRSKWEQLPSIWDGTEWVPLYEAVVAITLSNQTITAFSSGSPATARYEVQMNGDVRAYTNSLGWQQRSAGTDWIRPIPGAVPEDYQVRYTGFSGDPVFASATQNTWRALSLGSFQVELQTDSTGFDFQACSFTMEIRKGTGAVIDSCTVNLGANREDF